MHKIFFKWTALSRITFSKRFENEITLKIKLNFSNQSPQFPRETKSPKTRSRVRTRHAPPISGLIFPGQKESNSEGRKQSRNSTRDQGKTDRSHVPVISRHFPLFKDEGNRVSHYCRREHNSTRLTILVVDVEYSAHQGIDFAGVGFHFFCRMERTTFCWWGYWVLE